MTFQTKDDVPPPEKTHGRPSKYPFSTVKVGEYFDAPRDMGLTKDGKDARQQSIRSCACQYAKRNNPKLKFTTRQLNENTIRCWRVE